MVSHRTTSTNLFKNPSDSSLFICGNVDVSEISDYLLTYDTSLITWSSIYNQRNVPNTDNHNTSLNSVFSVL